MDSRSWPVAITGLVCVGVVLIVVILRFYYRLTIAKQLGIDDWIILVATVTLIALEVIGIYSKCFGNSWFHFSDSLRLYSKRFRSSSLGHQSSSLRRALEGM